MSYLMIFTAAIFVNNIVLSQFLGICPFLGVSKKTSTAAAMGAAIMFVLTVSSLATYLVQHILLDPMGLGFMQTVVFILVIAALVQMVEIILKKVSPELYQALGIFLPLITTNCAVLGIAINNLTDANVTNIFGAFLNGMFMGAGFLLALILMSGIREKIAKYDVPNAFKGFPIALVSAAIIAMAFMAFGGMF